MSDPPAEPSPEKPYIETTPGDRAIALAKSLATVLPGIGPIVSQIILDDLPGQRMDRIVEYVRMLDQRLSAVELEAKRGDPEAIDLFEEGAYQSTRATTDARRARIASVVAHGLKGDEAALIEAKRLLSLMQEVDDDQIIILLALTMTRLNDEGFYEQHERVLAPVYVQYGSSQDEEDRATSHELARARLTQLGLTRSRFSRTRKGELPEFDEYTGMVKSSGRELTDLGRLLLRRCDLIEDNEY